MTIRKLSAAVPDHRQQWQEIGIEVDIEAMEWNAYLEVLLGQRFDAVVIGWTGVVADNEVPFFAKYDIPGGGLSSCSFYRPDHEPLELDAKTVEGCAHEGRGAIYREIQEILYGEQPYIWLYAPRAIFAIDHRLGNAEQGPWAVCTGSTSGTSRTSDSTFCGVRAYKETQSRAPLRWLPRPAQWGPMTISCQYQSFMSEMRKPRIHGLTNECRRV